MELIQGGKLTPKQLRRRAKTLAESLIVLSNLWRWHPASKGVKRESVLADLNHNFVPNRATPPSRYQEN